jgi:PAS domain S-box-containing protein
VLTAWLTRLTTEVFRLGPSHSGLGGWWLMNALGILIVVPLAGVGEWLGTTLRKPRARLEAIVLLSAQALFVGGIATHANGPLAIPSAYLAIPATLLAILRLGPGSGAACSSLSALAVVVATSRGAGPFMGVPLEDRYVALQVFTFCLVCVPLVFAALLAERDGATAQTAKLEAARRALQECLPDVTYRIRADGTIVDASVPAGAEAFHSGADVAGKPISAVVPALAEGLWKACRSARQGEVNACQECDVRAGSILRTCEIRAVPLDGDEVLCLVRDVTQRKAAEQTLTWEAAILDTIARGRPSVEALRALLEGIESLSDGGLASILLVEGARLQPLLAPSLPAAYSQALEGLAIGPCVGSCGTAAHRKETVIVSDIAHDPLWEDKADFALRHGLRACWSVPIFDSASEVVGTFSIYYRIERAPRPEELALVERAAALAGIALERERRELLLDSLTRNVDEGLYRSTLERGLLYANEALARMFGYGSIEEFLRADPAALYADPARREELARLTRERGAVTREEALFRRRDGSTFWGSVTSRAVHDETGRFLHFDGVIADVTERKRLEAELRHAQKMEAVGRLAGGVAHDFNNLLTVIGGNAELLLARQRDPSQRERAAEIVAAVKRAADLTRQLLAFGRRQNTCSEVLDLCEVIDGFRTFLRRLIREDIVVTIEHSSKHLLVQADRGQLEQALLNLVLNARDALPSGGHVFISTEAVHLESSALLENEEAQPGDYARLVVEDDGTGMDETTRARAFEPFYTTKETGRGTGLGLATVYGVVHQCGGVISLDSAPGEGTRVVVHLPLTSAAPPARPVTESAPARTKPHGTVLVVEDEDLVREILTETLSAAGYTLLQAEQAEAALALVHTTSGPIDLLVTDVRMPGMSGHELAAELWRERPDMKVLFVSGYSVEAPPPERPSSLWAYLAKPFGPSELLARAQALLDAAHVAVPR